jgi:hypothetical protein
LGITDTSMLRPQVFALYENLDNELGEPVQIGLIASERQAINACLRSLAGEDRRFQPVADRYWVARGGSHTDGGSFRFTVTVPAGRPSAHLECANKFGTQVRLDNDQTHVNRSRLDPEKAGQPFRLAIQERAYHAYDDGGAPIYFNWLASQIPGLSWDEIAWGLDWMRSFAHHGEGEWEFSRQSMTLLRDRHYNTGKKRGASLLVMVNTSLDKMFDETPLLVGPGDWRVRRLTWGTRQELAAPADPGKSILVLDTKDFPAEGDQSAARWMVRATEKGWKRLVVYGWRGGRFAACGIGPGSQGVRVDLYGDVGDYVASGLDGAEVHLHGDGQDQLGQIFKSGKLVVYGDVGQTFLYGAKGGEIYVMGSAAGRPLINAVGNPRAVINGTCLDYLAESFMAGNPLDGGGFAILNGVAFDREGCLQELESPYPGNNLFSLASGGAIYLRDPHHKVEEDQLNGGIYDKLAPSDWALIDRKSVV